MVGRPQSRRARQAARQARRRARRAAAQARRQERRDKRVALKERRKHERRTLWEDARNLPNLLTFLRIVMIPAVLVFLEWGSPRDCYWAAIIYSLAAITDLLDGWLARRQGLAASADVLRRWDGSDEACHQPHRGGSQHGA